MKLCKMRFLAIFLLFMWSLCAIADDSNQSIIIESDFAERNEKTGLTQYTGNVVIRQGSLIIDAHQVEIHYLGNRVERILCNGSPASYQQLNKSAERVLARAETIEYLPAEKLINLKTDASLSRNGTLIKGDSIHYDLQNETWSAKGDNQSNQKRIQLVIPPLSKAPNSNAETSNIIEEASAK